MDVVSRRIVVLDETWWYLRDVMRLSNVHWVVGTYHVFIIIWQHGFAILCLISSVSLLNDWVTDLDIAVIRRRHLRISSYWVGEVLLHGRSISALRYLTPFLFTALSENASVPRSINLSVVFIFSGHLELFKGWFCKFLLNFFFKVNELQLYFRVDISVFLERPASQSYDVTLRGLLLATHDLFTVSDSLAHAIHIVRFSQAVLSRSSTWWIKNNFSVLWNTICFIFSFWRTISVASNKLLLLVSKLIFATWNGWSVIHFVKRAGSLVCSGRLAAWSWLI